MDNFDNAFKIALRFLKARPRSINEVKFKLRYKKFTPSVVDRVILRLKEYQLLDDYKFAQSWFEYRQNFKPSGQRLLIFEFKKFGIDEEIIEEILKKSQSEDWQIKQAMKAISKKKNLLGMPLKERKKKIISFLARRGFNFDIIDQVLKSLE